MKSWNLNRELLCDTVISVIPFSLAQVYRWASTSILTALVHSSELQHSLPKMANRGWW